MGLGIGNSQSVSESYEITIDANSTYIYDVEKYEEASYIERRYGHDSEQFKNAAKEFWDSGMILSDWQDWAKENKPESGSWEIIAPYENVLSKKKIPNRTIIENADEDRRSEVNHLLEPTRAQKRLIWRKKDVSDEQLSQIHELALNENLNKNFVEDMNQIYTKNAYKYDGVNNESVVKEIYQSYSRLAKKRGADVVTYTQLSHEEQKAFKKNVQQYITIAEIVTDSQE